MRKKSQTGKKQMVGEIPQNSGPIIQEEVCWGIVKCIDGFYSELEIRSPATKGFAALLEVISPNTLKMAEEYVVAELVTLSTSFYKETSANWKSISVD